MKEHKVVNKEFINGAVNKLVNFAKPTYGPNGYTVIISDEYRNDNLDDGVSISDAFELKDKFENAIIKSVKEVSRKTNDRVGDGTTGSLIILQALLNSDKVCNKLKKAAAELKEKLIASAIKIETKEELKDVSMVSYNDEEMAKIISNIVFEVGVDGVIAVEESTGLSTTTEVVNGLQFDKGYVSPYMITDADRVEAVLENPAVFITNRRIAAITDIMPILEKLMNAGKKDVLFIAEDTEAEALALLIINKFKGIFNTVAVRIPGYGDERVDNLGDIASLVGGTVITDDKGITPENITLDMLGSCKKVIITKDDTTIIGGDGDIEERIKQLKTQLKKATEEPVKDSLKSRIAKLKGGVALIKVGATTESEMKKIKYKVENAVNSTKLAYKSGVVQGAGIALAEITTCSEKLNEALKAPSITLKENLGDIKIDDNIIDPVEVIIASVECAVSIADMLSLTKGVIVEIPEKVNIPTM